MRFPYEGLVGGTALVILGMAFGDTWPKRIVGVVIGLGIIAHALLTGPQEVAARKAKRRRATRQRRARHRDE